jgi:glycosyltransferase involved in cell wall biosynthesis
MTRVLVQLNSLELGGTQLNALDFATEVAKWGYESVLIGPADTIPQGPSLFDVAAERGIELSSFDRPRTTLSGARMMSELANKFRADFIHVYGSWGYRSAWWGPCGLGRRPLVQTVYEMTVEKLTHTHTSLIVGTKHLEEELAERAGGVHLISPPVDISRDNSAIIPTKAFLRSHTLNPTNLRVVMVTRLDEEMKAFSVQTAIEAIGLMDRKDVDLVVVGTGNAERRLGKIGDSVNLKMGRKAVVFTGPMADPREAYAAADVMIGMGGSAARTLSFGKPLIVAGEAGWFRLFTPATSQEIFRSSFWSPQVVANPAPPLADILGAILNDEPLKESLSAFGRSFAETHFGLPAMAMKLADAYSTALVRFGPLAWTRDLSIEAVHFHRRLVAGRFPAYLPGLGSHKTWFKGGFSGARSK